MDTKETTAVEHPGEVFHRHSAVAVGSCQMQAEKISFALDPENLSQMYQDKLLTAPDSNPLQVS